MKYKKYIVIIGLLVAAFGVTLFFYSKQNEQDAIGELVFQSVDLNAQTVDEDIFTGYELTMVNIWGTYCSPCIEEMPDIEELYREMREKNVNIIGIVSDVGYPAANEDDLAEAKRIVEETGVSYQNILFEPMLESKLLNRITGVPATVFVNSEGKVVGDILVGAHSKLEYRKAIENVLEGK